MDTPRSFGPMNRVAVESIATTGLVMVVGSLVTGALTLPIAAVAVGLGVVVGVAEFITEKLAKQTIDSIEATMASLGEGNEVEPEPEQNNIQAGPDLVAQGVQEPEQGGIELVPVKVEPVIPAFTRRSSRERKVPTCYTPENFKKARRK